MPNRRPDRVVIVGAGAVGLSCAWYLQEHGVDVMVVDEIGAAAGASRGNGGYLSPALAVPLPEPGLLREGVRGLLRPGSPVKIGRRIGPSTLRFMAAFAGHSTQRRWQKGMDALTPLCQRALEAFDEMQANGVDCPTHRAPVMLGFETENQLAVLEHELDGVRKSGQEITLTRLQTRYDVFTDRIGVNVQLDGQRYIDPGTYVESLAEHVQTRGGRIVTGSRVRRVDPGASSVDVETQAGERFPADAVVLANGAWLPQLARDVGVRMPMQAGRGYSFTVQMDEPLPNPVYLLGVRVALTPLGGRKARVAGIMEIADPNAPLDQRRVDAIIRSGKPFLKGVNWDSIEEVWVGSRPLTTDGLPLIGETSSSRVFVAGGHGMWGVTLGPITGRLLASKIATNRDEADLAPFDPLRSGWPYARGRRLHTPGN